MRITISAGSLELLAARSTTGRLSKEDVERLPDGRYIVEVDDEIAAALELVHDDLDEALRILATTGVGHA